jgi:hypothetical protein
LVADAATEPDEGGYPSVADITVPASTSAYYIILTISTAAVTHSATPPTESADVIILGVCDSATRASTNELVIRQYVRADILNTGGGGKAQRYKIQSTATNYVVAKTWDGTNLGGTNVNIAIPTKLRGSAPVSGAAIRPAYAAGEEIYATEPTGGTGVAGCAWLDLNVDGRRWAVSRQVCTDGAAETLYFNV